MQFLGNLLNTKKGQISLSRNQEMSTTMVNKKCTQSKQTNKDNNIVNKPRINKLVLRQFEQYQPKQIYKHQTKIKTTTTVNKHRIKSKQTKKNNNVVS